jgi:hypothetical protein
MPPSPALTTQKSSSKLASLAWFTFKLGFGLFCLAFTWVTIAWKNGVFQPKDTDEEKKELETGILSLTGEGTESTLTCNSAAKVLESRS